MMTGTIYVSELQYWINKVLIESVGDKTHIPHPTYIDDTLPVRSFIEMLFNENYSYDDYLYLYEGIVCSGNWPTAIRDRLRVYEFSQYYVLNLNETGENIFNLVAADLQMLDILLAYRTDATSVIMIDTTADTIFRIPDATADIRIVFDSLTNLSKLIFIYLDFKINQNYSRYNNTSSIASSLSLLENCYEAYIIEEIFKGVSTDDIEGNPCGDC